MARVFLLFDGELQEVVHNGKDVDVAHILNVVTGGHEGAAT